jgi:hypothetical protein
MKKYTKILIMFAVLGTALMGCGDSNAVSEEEKAEVKTMETVVVEMDSAAAKTESKKEDAKAALNDLMNEFNAQ